MLHTFTPTRLKRRVGFLLSHRFIHTAPNDQPEQQAGKEQIQIFHGVQ